MAKYLAGIDIGSSCVTGVLTHINDDGSFQIITVDMQRCIPFKKPLILNQESIKIAIEKCVDTLENISGSMIDKVVVSIPRSASVENNATYFQEDYDNNNDALLKEDNVIEYLIKFFNSDANHVDEIVFYSDVLAVAHIKNKLHNDYVAIFDIGEEFSEVSIYNQDNICYTSFIPLGGGHITRDISKCLKISLEDAEKLKVKYGDVSNNSSVNDEEIEIKSEYEKLESIKRSLLVEIINARAEEILNYTFDKLSSSGFYDDVKMVIITGGGLAMFGNISNISQRILNKNVKIVEQEFVKDSVCTLTTVLAIIDKEASRYVDVCDDKEGKIKLENKKTAKDKFSLKIQDLFEKFF